MSKKSRPWTRRQRLSIRRRTRGKAAWARRFRALRPHMDGWYEDFAFSENPVMAEFCRAVREAAEDILAGRVIT